jgi:hypothetical protein
MITLILQLAITLAAAGPVAGDNPVLADLTQKGVQMPDGTVVKLPPPTMSPGMTAAAQTAAIKGVLMKSATLERFMATDSDAPISYRIKTVEGKDGAVFRTIDISFVAHGDWKVLNSEKFADSLTKTAAKPAKANEEGAILKSGFLTDAEMKKRGLQIKAGGGRQDRYFYTTFALFDRVQVSVTRYAVLTRTADSVLLATQVDPRFAKDREYPNEWRSIEKNAAAQRIIGKDNPYSGAAFYVKVTRLAQPADAIFVEYHSVFNEPYGWFEGENLLRSKLGTIANFQVKQFRGKWGRASSDTEDKAAAQR